MKMEKLKDLRKAKNLTYEKVAQILYVSKPYYWQIENGKRRLSYPMAVQIANIFGLKPDDIFYQYYKNKEN